MKAKAGSTAWLLRHDLRLDWRRRASAHGARRWMALVITLGAPLFLGLFAGVPLALMLDHFGPPTSRAAEIGAASVLVAAFLFMLSQALAEIVDALYERGDLDLLFASPISPRRVITVRALGVAFAAFSVFGFFAFGPLVAIAVMGHPLWLATLVVLYACALSATGVALALSALMIRHLGPRRTRWIGRGLAVGLGSIIFLATQVFTLMDGRVPGPATGLRLGQIAQHLAPGPTGLILRAFQGEPGPFLIVTGLLLLPFLLATAWFGPGFAAFQAAAQGASAGRARAMVRPARFRRSLFAAVWAKEVRLLLRDSMLLPQVVLRVVYLAPVALLTVRYGAQMKFDALSGAVVALTLMSSQLAGSLAWMTVSAEDAPDLLASSPASPSLIARVKLTAAVGTVMALVSLAAIPLAFAAPYEALVVFAGGLAASLSAGLMNLWWQRPGRRNAFRKRAPAPWFVTVAELALGLLIALSAGLFSIRQVSGVAPALLALALLAALGLTARR